MRTRSIATKLNHCTAASEDKSLGRDDTAHLYLVPRRDPHGGGVLSSLRHCVAHCDLERAHGGRRPRPLGARARAEISSQGARGPRRVRGGLRVVGHGPRPPPRLDRKSTRLNSSHLVISYAVFCLKKKKNKIDSI